jgi:hypothetical protein
MGKHFNALVYYPISVLFFFLAGIHWSFGQVIPPVGEDERSKEQCATVFFEQKQANAMGYFGSRQYFESWVGSKKVQLEEEKQRNRRLDDEIRQLPVVVHVIHHGEAIGEGANISDAQILDQIRILNEDFQMTNPDFITNTPNEFLDVASDARIEFVLAKQDPQGMPSNGINRVLGPKSTYGLNDAALVGQLASWAPEEYINIWVLPLTPPTIGFASFPVSDELPGLGSASANRQKDGVTIDHSFFGSIGNISQNSRGRTATHEMGHFLGLRHIWGDGGCEVDDFVADTPLQSQSNNSCIVTPRFTCDSRDMVENFMDYTPDRCMSLFTEGQVERIDVILAFSPRRASLPTSRALNDPQLFENDIELRNIISPSEYTCTNSLTPVIEVMNKGTSGVSSIRARILVNQEERETRDFVVSLPPGTSAQLEFSALMVNADFYRFTAEVLLVNGAEDDDFFNNTLSVNTTLPAFENLPYAYPGHNEASGWEIKNEDRGQTWQPINLQIDNIIQDVFYLNSFNYPVQGELDYLISPVLDFTEVQNPQLSFDLAYSPFANSAFNETLIVAVSTDCGNTFDLLSAPYNKTENSLATQESTVDGFFPDAEDQFRKEIVNLHAFAGLSSIRVAFVSINDYGNNIFLKNISLNTEETFRYQLGINGIEAPLPVVNGDQTLDRVRVLNTGNLSVSSFFVSKSINGIGRESILFDENNLVVGESTSVEIPNFLDFGLNQVDYEVSAPNYDQNPGNGNQISRYFLQTDATILSPWRQNFDAGELGAWETINPENNLSSWDVITSSEGGNELAFLGNMISENSYWLVSPEFSLGQTGRAGLFFDWGGSGFSSRGLTHFSLMVSKDGGQTGQTLWEVAGDDLNKEIGPANENDPSQRNFINLNAFAGEEKVRLYFKVNNINDPDGRLLLDNISLYFSDDPDPVIPEINETLIYPNPANDNFSISFNLADYEDVNIQFFSTAGQMVYDVSFPNTLNQTYSFGKAHLSIGLYIVKINGENFTLTRRLVLN